MKRRLLSTFLAVMMVLTMAPVAFAADEGGVKSYDELTTAISSANPGDTIKLANDITLTDTLSINKNVTLDGQGHTISGTVPSGKSFISVQIPNDGDFTMTNCVIVPSGNVTPNPAINLRVNGKVSVTNCTFGAKSDTAGYMYNGLEFSDTYAMGDTNITGNTFYGGAFRHNCISFYKMAENANINISNNDFVDLNWDTTNAIRVSNYSSANATITLNSNIYSTHGSDAGKDYAGLLFFQITNSHNDDLTKLNVVVNGLKTDFDGQLYYTYKDGVGLTSENEAVFHGDDSIAKYFVAKIGNTYYKTLADAVAAAQDGQTVKMLNDTKVTEEISFSGKKITLDLNGKIIAGVFNDYCSVIEAQGTEATLIVEDNSNGAQGKITSNHYGLTGRDDGSIIVNSGMIETGDGAALSGNNTTGNMNFTVNGGTLTTKSGPAIYQPGQCKLTITGGTLNGGISLRMGQVNISGGTINAATENLDSPAQYYNYSGNAWLPDALYVFGGTYNSTDSTYGNSLNLNITGGTFNCNNGQGSAIAIYDIGKVAQVAKITISGDAKLATTTSNRKAYDVLSLSDIGVTNPDTGYGNKNLVGKVSTAISGGYFTTDPSAYCVTGKTGVSSGNTTYPWTVGEKIANTKPAEVADATVAATVDKNASEAAQDAAKEIGGAMMAQNEVIKAAAKNEANQNKIDADTLVDGKTVTQKLQKVDPTITSDKVKIVYQTYIDVEVKDAAQENSNFTELTVELTPMYRVIAAQRGVTDYHVDVDKNTSSVNAVQIVGEKPLTLTGKYEVTLQLPNGFVVPSDNKLSIKHQKSSGVEYYTGTVDTTSAAKMVTFETNGFSPFTISAVAAYVGTTAYPTLQEAANAANSGDTIVVKNGASHDLTFTATKSVKVKNETGADVTVKFNGTDKKFGDGETETFTYTKPSSGSSSGGSSSGKTTYKVTTSAVNNGGVNASPSNAEKGATITITLSPDKGYKLDKLTVTDGSGKTVSTVKKSDTVYTFTMPASAVKVGVSYVKATETPSETKFNDVSANDWFASAVDYVTGKGMMNGTADNTFSPKANTTRGMVVTVLYRLENQPSTSAASFTDVASGAYYANAVAWANANGIVSGYGSGKFGPNDKVTREQLAAILYRYAQYKKYDVSVGEDTNILSYDDAQSISSYAIPAIQWACGAGVVTGKSGSKLDPKGNATRAEVAAMLMRFCENVK